MPSCCKCKETKLKNEFPPNKANTGREQCASVCKKCNKLAERIRRTKPNYKTYYKGTQWPKYLEKLEKLAGRPKPETCEVCGERRTASNIVWDHNHDTGLFRGWLCRQCNAALGLVKDQPSTLRALAEYLEK